MTDASPDQPIACLDDQDRPGWKIWRVRDRNPYNAILDPLSVRVEDGRARVQITQRTRNAKRHGRVPGGVLLGFIDIALFAGALGLGAGGVGSGLTLELSTQFGSSARMDRVIEQLRESRADAGPARRAVQLDEPAIASFAATLRKVSA